jgi:hypothetical protein
MATHWVNKSNDSVTVNGATYWKTYGTNYITINSERHWIQPNGTIRIVDPIKPIQHPMTNLRYPPNIRKKKSRTTSTPKKFVPHPNPNGLRCRKCKMILSIAKNGPYCFKCRN